MDQQQPVLQPQTATPQPQPQAAPESVKPPSNKKLLPVLIAVPLILFAILAIVFLTQKETPSSTNETSQQVAVPNTQTNQTAQTPPVQWEFNGESWKPLGSAPACEEPIILKSPVDVSKARAVLYPGQKRSDDYKPHGGFLLNGSNDVTITAPFDGVLVHGSRYIEQEEVQYLLFFVNPCGMAYRFDHLLSLSPEMQKIADTLPEAKADDSRTTKFTNQVLVKKGDVIAIAVGFRKNNNVSFDLGVYDLRKQNEASQNPAYAAERGNLKEQAYYALCWLNMISEPDKSVIKKLPAGDQASGSTSDYCN